MLEDIESECQIVGSGQVEREEVAPVNATADTFRRPRNRVDADLDALGCNAVLLEHFEHRAGSAPDLERAHRRKRCDDLRDDALVDVDPEIPDTGLFVVTVLEDAALQPVEIRRRSGVEDGDGLSVGQVHGLAVLRGAQRPQIRDRWRRRPVQPSSEFFGAHQEQEHCRASQPFTQQARVVIEPVLIGRTSKDLHVRRFDECGIRLQGRAETASHSSQELAQHQRLRDDTEASPPSFTTSLTSSQPLHDATPPLLAKAFGIGGST